MTHLAAEYGRFKETNYGQDRNPPPRVGMSTQNAVPCALAAKSATFTANELVSTIKTTDSDL
jgi:hypothetical protein